MAPTTVPTEKTMNNDRIRKSRLGVMLTVGSVMVLGCTCSLIGDDENIEFHYGSPGFSGGSSGGQRIAVEAKVDVFISDRRDDAEDLEEGLTIVDAFSDDAQTLDVIEVTEDWFRLEAYTENMDEGTRVHVEARDERGVEVSDSVSMKTEEVGSIEIGTSCSEGELDAVYLTESAAVFDYRLATSKGGRLAGWGYYPVDVTPESGGMVRADHENPMELVVDTGNEPGSYELAPHSVYGDAYEFEMIEGEEIEGGGPKTLLQRARSEPRSR